MGSTLSIGGRLIKIHACLSNIDVYQMSMRLPHKTNIESLSWLSFGLEQLIKRNTIL
jgi:hypothetical protein